jgi:hypothetical protein
MRPAQEFLEFLALVWFATSGPALTRALATWMAGFVLVVAPFRLFSACLDSNHCQCHGCPERHAGKKRNEWRVEQK